MRTPEILYLAIDQGNGHLVRAHLLRNALASAGAHVEIVTTSERGVRFLAELGTPSRTLESGFGAEYDGAHNLLPGASERRMLRYVASSRVRRDGERIAAWGRNADLLVNDAVHPLLLWARWRDRVVHVCGESIWSALESHFDRRLPSLLSARYRCWLRRARDSAFGEITYAPGIVEAERRGPRRFRLPPLLATPDLPGPSSSRERLAVVYLNDHFRDDALIRRIDAELRRRGFRVHGVTDVATDLPGYAGADSRLVDAIAHADVLISGAGAASVEQARVFGVPLIAIVGNHPEQARNLERARESELPVVRVAAQDPRGFARALDWASSEPIRARRKGLAHAAQSIARTRDAYVSAFVDLLAQKREVLDVAS